jgi:hypothetical protein
MKSRKPVYLVRLDDIDDDIDHWPLSAVQTTIMLRFERNLRTTGHPFHHETADGTVVDTDPTLEYLIKRLTSVRLAAPVNRRHYGFDPYQGK